MKPSKKKTNLLLVGAVIVLVAVTLAVYFLNASSRGITYGYAAPIILLLIIMFAAFAFNRRREAGKGGVIEDERSRNITNISLARAYLLSLYWFLGLGFFSEDLGLDSVPASAITGLGILGMAILLGISYIYTSRFDASIEG